MTNSTTIVACGAIVAYTGGFWLLLRQRDPGAGRAPMLAATATGALLHTIALGRILLTPAGIDLSLFSTAALVSLMITLLFLVATLNRPLDRLGLAVLPLAALTLLLRLAFPREVHPLAALPAGMQLHILLSILAFSLLNVAAFQAVLLAWQDWRLRHRQPGRFVRSLPPLQAMETLLFQLIGVGFVLLSGSLATGLVFVEDLFAQHLVHKTVLSILSWGVFGSLLWGRWRYGWRGKTAIRWTLGGFAALLLAYFGTKLVLELILRRA